MTREETLAKYHVENPEDLPETWMAFAPRDRHKVARVNGAMVRGCMAANPDRVLVILYQDYGKVYADAKGGKLMTRVIKGDVYLEEVAAVW